MVRNHKRLKVSCLFLVGCFIFVATITLSCCVYNGVLYSLEDTQEIQSQYFAVYSNTSECTSNYSQTVDSLIHLIQSWQSSKRKTCRNLYQDFDRIYSVGLEVGHLQLPKSFIQKLKTKYHFTETIINGMYNQNITKVFNKVTDDGNMYNLFREKRPVVNTTADDKSYVENVTFESAKSCDFCQYQKYTAYDTFGRIESQHSFIIANAFKYDRWHSMVIFRKHHPLDWNKEIFIDAFNTALKWLDKVHSIEPEYIYPIIIWDLLPHASASQIHPHIHLSITKDRYYGALEHWRLSAIKYKIEEGRNYFIDLLNIHTSLGLSVQEGSAVAFASLTPKRDHEFVVLGSKPNEDFFTLLYYIIRTYIEIMNKYCLSMAIALPPMNSGENVPMGSTFARIVTRGSVSEIRTDASSLELFAGSNVNVDPYKSIELLRSYIKKMNK